MNHVEVVSISGTFRSGKDISSKFLADWHSYLHVSTGDLLRAEATRRGLSPDRTALEDIGNEWRRLRGAGVLGKVALEQYQAQKDQHTGLVVSGVRSVGEAEMIKSSPFSAKGIFLDAPIEMRFQRQQNQGRLGDEMTLEDFIRNEAYEMSSGGEDNSINLSALRAMADVVIINDGSLDELFAQLEEALNLPIRDRP